MSGFFFANIKADFDPKKPGTVGECTELIEKTLKELKTDRKLVLKSVLLSEEITALMTEHCTDNARLRVQIKKFPGDRVINISCEGEEFDPYLDLGTGIAPEDNGDEITQQAISSLILKSLGEQMKFSHKSGMNSARISTGHSGKAMLINTVIALVLGIAAGLLLRFVLPADIAAGVSEYALTPAKTMFMNALKFVIGPIVFLSIATCISQFKDLSELGRLGAKVMGTYLFTTVMAVLFATGFSFLISPGQFGQFAGLNIAGEVAVAETDTSLLSTIVNIVPSDVITPFLKSDTLQLIFMAVLVGIAVASLGKRAAFMEELLDSLNSVFLKITSMITSVLPVAIFCSISLIILNADINALTSMLSMAGAFFASDACMLAFYGLMILVVARLNPLTFFRKNREGMITSFVLSSSSAAMPTNMRTCTDKLGISPKVCSFSIPLGATVNMDGACIFMTIATLFLAKGYGIEITTPALLSLLVTIILLSLGAPGVPGAGIVCIGVALQSVGVPVEALGLIIGIYPFFDMFTTMSNTTGDVAAALVVAKREGLVDMDVYSRK